MAVRLAGDGGGQRLTLPRPHGAAAVVVQLSGFEYTRNGHMPLIH